MYFQASFFLENSLYSMRLTLTNSSPFFSSIYCSLFLYPILFSHSTNDFSSIVLSVLKSLRIGCHNKKGYQISWLDLALLGEYFCLKYTKLIKLTLLSKKYDLNSDSYVVASRLLLRICKCVLSQNFCVFLLFNNLLLIAYANF